MPRTDLTGRKFHRLKVLGFSHNDERGRSYYRVLCECGTRKLVAGSKLKRGDTKSCGCLAREAIRHRLPNHGGAINNLILQYRRNARKRNLDYALPRDVFVHLIRQRCAYCNAPPGNRRRTKNDREGILYNGLDRVNSRRGYVVGNVVPCCATCNIAKGRMPLRTFLAWVRRVFHHTHCDRFG